MADDRIGTPLDDTARREIASRSLRAMAAVVLMLRDAGLETEAVVATRLRDAWRRVLGKALEKTE